MSTSAGREGEEETHEVDDVEDKRDALPHRVRRDPTHLRELSVLANLLSVVEDEAGEDGDATVRRDGLESREGAESHAGHQHRGEVGADEDAETGEQGTALCGVGGDRVSTRTGRGRNEKKEKKTNDPEEFLALSSSSDLFVRV